MTSNEIRSRFLDFFASKQHQIVPSAPMVIKNDPTLMFTNAGMNPFKDLFLGNSPIVHSRIVDSQKCLRVSGKHNDLEEVGHDTYHHTMFEMLGNWSFGDYFKKEAIDWAWEFLTEVLKIDKDILYVTVFGGDEKDGTAKDMEAYELWKQYVPESRILFGSKKDNFWEMGESGPCGPCSEIHVDIRSAEEKSKVLGSDLVNKDHPHVIEIWNLVFMQFNRTANGQLLELPNKHVDTGMGFERLCMVIQGKQSNYDTDVFQPLIQAIAKSAHVQYGENKEVDIALRVIADHLRAVSFAIADGQLPSNNKAGYVIRRILRRAVRYGYTFLNQKDAFIYNLLPVLVGNMGAQFPELKAQQEFISKVIFEEENSFLKTLETGIRLLNQKIQDLKVSGGKLSGKDVFTLFDTYGFPPDLTDLILKENNLTSDFEGFEKEMEAQKARSRNAASSSSEDWVELERGNGNVFVGYDRLQAPVKILKYRKVITKNQEEFQLVFDQTPFYAESGGQCGDSGYIESSSTKEKYHILDTKKENNLIIHKVKKLPEHPGEIFTAFVSENSRIYTEDNHTATHLLHYALRQVLGAHVEQKGSMVNDLSLRFDFAHYQKLSETELRQVEELVNALIRKNIPLNEYREISMEEAVEMGAMALFSEKYGDKVRVVQYGDSVELCGGTHAKYTGQLGFFKIISESAVAAGVRRIEAVTAFGATSYLFSIADTLKEVRDLLKTANVIQGIKKIIGEHGDLKKEVENHVKEKVDQLYSDLMKHKVLINDIPVVQLFKGYPVEIIKNLAFKFRKEMPSGIFVTGGIIDDKAVFHLMVGDDLVKKGLNASTIVKVAAPLIDGSGGGQPFYATCTGPNVHGAKEAIEQIYKALGIWEPGQVDAFLK